MICASCGNQTHADQLCPFHASGESDWASVNRIMCAFFHRRVVPPRLDEAERFDTNIPSTPPEQPVATFVYADGYE